MLFVIIVINRTLWIFPISINSRIFVSLKILQTYKNFNFFILGTNWLTVGQKIEEDVKHLKIKLHEAIEEKKINLKPLAAEKKRLANKTHALNEKAKEICTKINVNLLEQVEICQNDILGYVSRLEKNELALNALQRVISIHACVEKSSRLLEQNLFLESYNGIRSAKDIINTCEDLQPLIAFNQICNEARKLERMMKTSMQTAWKDCVHLHQIREAQETRITISLNKDKSSDMREVIQTVYQMEDKGLVEIFLESVRFQILLPQITSYSQVNEELTDETAKLVITIDTSSKTPHYLQAFDRITAVLNFMHTHMNVVIPNHGDLFRVMGQSMAQEVTEKLMENALSQMVLEQPEQQETLGEIVANAEKLESTLKRMGFLAGDVSLMETDGADLFFTNMIYGLYLEKARNIMKKKILNSCQLELKLLEVDDFTEPIYEQDKKFLDTCTTSLIMK